ncbi:D-alanine--D-alanine ligase family protein [Thermodesulfobacteriota bacterium]
MSGGPVKVALVFGGRSAEHEVSLRSARSVYEAMDKSRYDVMPVFITLEGTWYRMPATVASFDAGSRVNEADRLVLSQDPSTRGLIRIPKDGAAEVLSVDVVIPILHGTYGEDGTLQGLLDMADVPYVGCGVLASAVGMDKVFMKAAFRASGLEVGPFFWFLRSEWQRDRSPILDRAKKSRLPLFVKPANMGSSVGVSRVDDLSKFEQAVELAAKYDRKIIVEDGIEGRELEVSVLGNDEPEASVAGEVVSHSKAQFYDYEEKYLDDTAELTIPADVPEEVHKKAATVAKEAFKAVDGSGLGRVDMFLTPDGRAVVNEINTLPGFTSVSMYPKLWEASGLSYSKLIDRLVELAIERHSDKQQTQTCRKDA